MMRQRIILLFFLFLPLGLRAEQVVEHGDYRLHYMAMVTEELPPAVAQVYGITRSSKQGVLILNLQQQQAPLVSLASEAKGRIRNLIGQERLDELREVRERDAIYWIATFSFSHLETMRFDFELQPKGSNTRIALNFSQQFYTPGR